MYTYLIFSAPQRNHFRDFGRINRNWGRGGWRCSSSTYATFCAIVHLGIQSNKMVCLFVCLYDRIASTVCYGTRTKFNTSDAPYPVWLDVLRASWLVLGTFVAHLWPRPPFTYMKNVPRLVTLFITSYIGLSLKTFDITNIWRIWPTYDWYDTVYHPTVTYVNCRPVRLNCQSNRKKERKMWMLWSCKIKFPPLRHCVVCCDVSMKQSVYQPQSVNV